jgi:cell cycle sensor histidine kinase DivJ
LADPVRLQRLLLNIVSNAVKFTEKGGKVAVSASRNEEGDLLITVEDDGCGVPSGQLERVFEPFFRGGGAEGSGLGLHIAKGLAALHDADLSLSSEPGLGAKAVLRLPKSRVIESSNA